MTRTVDPEEALRVFQTAGLQPLEAFPGATKPWRSRHLLCGREVAPLLTNVRRRGSGCRPCAAVQRGADRRAALADAAVRIMTDAGFTPLQPYPGANEPWRCRHEPCGLELMPRLSQVRRGDLSCRTCGRLAKGHHAWTPASAARAFQAAGLTPLEPYPGSSTRPWRATHDGCGSVVSPRLGNIAAGQGPCAVCGRRQQALTIRLPEELVASTMRAADLEPLDPYPGADARWRCRHLPCGREVHPSYSNVRKGQNGCAWCAHRELGDRFRMPEADAVEVMRQAGLTPVDPYPGSGLPWRCVHERCGREVTPTLSNVRQGAGICRYCNSAFPFDGPAVLYLIGNDLAWKIGIAAVGSDRLRQHRRWGWTTQWVLDMPTGDHAWNAERAVIAWWRHELGAPAAYTAGTMPQGGETETIARDLLSAHEVREFAAAYLG